MRKLLLSTVAFAALAIAPAYAQSTTGTMLSGTGVTCTPSTAASTTGTSTDTTASTSGTTGSGTSTDTTASTSGTTTGSGTSTDTTASTGGTTTGSGTSTDTTASTSGTTTGSGTSTDTTASTSGTTTGAGTSSSTMALSANNQIDATVARTALTNAQTNVDRLSSFGTPSTVCLVDLDTLAQSDETLKGDISKFETNNAQIKSALEANSALISNIKTNHPTFDVSKVRGVDIGPNNELVLYVVSGT
jgi:hypothetical protein